MRLFACESWSRRDPLSPSRNEKKAEQKRPAFNHKESLTYVSSGPSALHLFTIEEVASQLRVSRRWLQDFIKIHPFYNIAGRRKVLSNPTFDCSTRLCRHAPQTRPAGSASRTPNYRVRGTYLGVEVDRSTETHDQRKAQAFLGRLKDAIERGAFSSKQAMTLAAAVTSYIQAGGENRFFGRILLHFGKLATVDAIDQAAIDAGAARVYPHATPGTRNRQFYTPLLAAIHHSGIATEFRRPRGLPVALGRSPTPRPV